MAELTVRHADEMGIEIQFQNALVKGFTFAGKQTLTNHSYKLVLTEEKAAELAGLLGEYRPQVWTEKYGDHITTEENERYDWELDHVEGDAFGVYRALTDEGTGPLTMEITQDDIVSLEDK